MRSYSRNQYYRPASTRHHTSAQPHSRWLTKPFLYLGLFITVFFGGTYVLPTTIHAAINAHNQQIKQQAQQQLSDKLSAVINPILAANSSVKIGIGIDDAQTDMLRTYGQQGPYEAASTGKIMTALAYYHAVEHGQLDLTHALGSFTAGYQMQQMINQSNNISWSMLADELGDSRLQQYATSIGSSYQVNGNLLTPGSLATTLVQLKQDKLLNAADTAQLLSYMQDTNDEELIPAALPAGVTIYHKYGLLNGALHDASILTDHAKTFSLVIDTQSADDSDDLARTAVFHQLVRAIVPVLFAQTE